MNDEKLNQLKNSSKKRDPYAKIQSLAKKGRYIPLLHALISFENSDDNAKM